jgi:hypothetical protein
VSYRKKTVFWLSIWDGYFKANFFFLDRHLDGIAALKIDEKSFSIEKEWAQMIPLIFKIDDKRQFVDLQKIIKYKKIAK